MSHQAADEMLVSGESVELGDGNWRLALLAGLDQRCGELRTTIECVCALASLNLSELSDDLEPFGFGEARDGGALRINAQAGLALLASADPALSHQPFLLPITCF